MKSKCECDKEIKLFNILQFWLYKHYSIYELQLDVYQSPFDKRVFHFEIFVVVDHYLDFTEDLKDALKKRGFELEEFEIKEISPYNGDYVSFEIYGQVRSND